MRILLLFLLFSSSLTAQTLRFEPWFDGKPLVLTEEEGANAGAGLRIETMRVYLSGFVLLLADSVVYREPGSYHLLDAADTASLSIDLAAPERLAYDAVRFLIGVDSARAAAGVFGGALDPTNGMYWTWRSGYINFKLEGIAEDCPARGSRFQFHIGGYQAPYNSIREVRLKVPAMEGVAIRIDLDRLLAGINLSNDYQVMSPNEASVKLADRLIGIFVVHPGKGLD